jgi:raffinose/stachyose/melibiose transport system substrate-binding protein
VFQQSVSRRNLLLKGAGTAVALGSLGGLAGASRAWATPKAAEATTISAWIFRPEYRDAIDAMVTAFEKSHPNISVNMKYTPSQDYTVALKTALVGGAATDVYATSAASGIRGDTGADGGYAAQLDGQVPLKQLLPQAANVVQYKNHVWAAPAQMFRIGLYINRDLFSKYKVRLPRTWADLEAVCKVFQSNGVVPIVMGGQDMILPWFFYALAVNSITGPKGFQDLRTGKRKLTDAALLPAAQYTVDMGKYFEPGFQAVSYTEAKALFAQGRGAMIIGGSSDYAGYVQINPKLQVGFIGFPPRKKTLHIQGWAMSGLSMAMIANKKASNLAAAKNFAVWWSSAEAQKAILNNLGLPSRLGIKPTGNTDRDRVLKSILAVPETPSWLDYQETGNSLTKALTVGNKIFTGGMSPKDFAAALQSDFTTSG